MTNKQLKTAYRDYKIYIRKIHRGDIWNADEMGCNYAMAPDCTMCASPVARRKKLKKRLTPLMCANSSGTEKFHFVFLGSGGSPRCFQKKTGELLGFDYAHNKKAWMMMDLFLSGCFGLILK